MKILVALSGGVDSSVTAKLLKDAGHEIVGCYMVLHENPNYHEENIKKVRAVGEFLGIDVQISDLQEKFANSVYTPFIEAYRDGKTPNPCAVCNRFIKFGALAEIAKSLNCDKMATGHYARIENGLIKAARDDGKDQSYFLANIDREILNFVIFPLGEMLKSEVKNYASKFSELEKIAAGRESSEICFVDTTYIDILNRHFKTDLKGNVKNKFGEIVGSHDGYMHYTIGKRRGFSVHGAHEPHYVTKIDAKNNEIYVGTKNELETTKFSTLNANLFLDLPSNFEAQVKIRYRSPKIAAKVKFDGEKFDAVLSRPAYGVASGQLAVFYDDFERVIASGFIQ